MDVLLRYLPLTGLLLLVALSHAAELESVTVDRDDEGRYVLRSEALFDAPLKPLFELLTDYDQFKRFSSAFTESRNLEPDAEGRPQFYNRVESCVLFFCPVFERYGHLEIDSPSRIHAVVDAERSDFRFSEESWTLSRKGDRTLMVYEFEMEPDFWVPPVIGPFYIRRTLREGAVRAIDRIEAIALGEEPEPVGQ